MVEHLVIGVLYCVGVWSVYERAAYYLPRTASRTQTKILAFTIVSLGMLIPAANAGLWLGGVTNSGIYAATTVILVLAIICIALILMGRSSPDLGS